jgi:NAD(P)-dependent dehydrogenase (short-subunit alcohol dehydrogenase family)
MKLQNRVAIVTGSRRGIGKSIASALAKEGASVVVTDVNQPDCQAVVDEIESSGGRAIAIKCDVSLKTDVQQMVAKSIETFGKVDILVNNAMYTSFKPFMRISEEEWDHVINVNLKGAFLCSQIAAKNMIKNEWGRIINIASIASGGSGGSGPLLAHYIASKGGMKGLTQAMAIELSIYGINVNAILPGPIDSGVLPDSIKESTLKVVPKGRLGRPDDIGNLAVFLSSEESDYITGSYVVIDGGISII